MAELGDGDRLAAEAEAGLFAIGEVRVEDLDRDLTLENRVATAVDDGHPAVTHLGLDLVLIQPASDECGHPWVLRAGGCERRRGLRPTMAQALLQIAEPWAIARGADPNDIA